jgi:hypothetical protein
MMVLAMSKNTPGYSQTMTCMEVVRKSARCNMGDNECVSKEADALCTPNQAAMIVDSVNTMGRYRAILKAFMRWKNQN